MKKGPLGDGLIVMEHHFIVTGIHAIWKCTIYKYMKYKLQKLISKLYSRTSCEASLCISSTESTTNNAILMLGNTEKKTGYNIIPFRILI